MKKKLLTIILSCALAFSATACGSSAETNSSKENTETETKTPIEVAVESTRTIGEINREAAAAQNPAEEPEITVALSSTTEQGLGSSFQDSMGGDLLSSFTGDMSAESALTELPDTFTFTLPEGFYETEDGIYMNYDDSDPAYIGCFALVNDDFSNTSMDADEAEVTAYFETLADEMESEFYNSYGTNVNVSILESQACQIDGNDGYTVALQYDAPDYGFTMLQFVGVVQTQDYIYFFHCMEALGTNYYDDFKACFNSINVE